MNALRYKTVSAKAQTIQKNWIVVDAENAVLGRLASEVARRLRGKHRPDFTPHVDCGDYVIVINADKVRLTGNKWNAKEYLRYTEYPGGQRRTLAKELMAKKPIAMIEKAVKGMLPGNRLGRQMFRNLHVYAAAEHPHDAQQPTTLTIN